MTSIDPQRYAALYGPTTGDRVRLADTDLWLEVERDLCAGGDEAVFGGGKTIRESMLQGSSSYRDGSPELVITNVVVLDHWGVVKADVGVREGRIVAIGKSGNPDVMDGVDPALRIGPCTDVIAGEGRILTAGGIDCHVHLITPSLVTEALASGITTLVGGGTGPTEGTRATTVTPSPSALTMMHRALDAMPVNVLLLGKGNTVAEAGFEDQVLAGAGGFKLHEDWGTTPAAIDACLRACDRWGVQAAIHTDTLNEAGFLQATVSAIAGRSIHTYHTEGAGGGHAPDIIAIAALPNVLPSSTNPTRPYTVNTLAEHQDMLIVCHHLNPRLPEDLAFAESRIRGTTMAAEDLLQDLGAISIIGSDAQAMGRAGETIIRTWQTAHVAKHRWGAGGRAADNERCRRYVAKYTICPAVAHGIADTVGSVEVGKLADLVLWDPAWFGVRPRIVLKGGQVAWAPIGDANASIPTPEPVFGRPMFAASGAAAATVSVAFVAPAALEAGLADRLQLVRRLVPVADTRTVAKADLPLNDATPSISVDPETFVVTVDGAEVEPAPVAELPLAQRYSLFLTEVLELLLADARTPSGSHAHSAGLEGALAAGLQLAGVPDFMRARLWTVARLEASFAAAACRSTAVDELCDLEDELAARIVPEPLRRASSTLGRGLLRTASVLLPDAALLARYTAASELTLRPVALGVVGAAGDLEDRAVARVALYEDASAVAAAAVKLLPLDAAQASRWLLMLADEIGEVAQRACADGLVSTCTPLLDGQALDHHLTERRLFVT